MPTPVFMNRSVPMVGSGQRNVTLVKLVQFEKAKDPILVTLLGIITEDKEEQYINVAIPMV